MFSLANSRFLKKITGAFSVAIAARAAQFYGAFTFALGAGLIIGQLSAMGWPTLMQRLIPQYQINAQPGLLKGLTRWGDVFVAIAASAAAMLTVGASFAVTSDQHLAAGLVLSALIAPVMAFRRLRRQQLASLNRPAAGMFLDEALSPLAVLLVAVVVGFGSAADATYVYTVSGALGVLWASVLLRRRLGPAQQAPGEKAIGLWFSMSLPMIAGVASKILMSKTDVVMLAPLSNMEQVGLYGAAFRLTYLMTFPQVVLSTVLAPMLSATYAKGNFQGLKSKYNKASIFAAATSIPVALALTLFASEIMALVFGPNFAVGGEILAIVAVGQALTSMGIPSQSLLLMTGKERFFTKVNTASLVINIGLNFFLISKYGALGAAVSFSLTALLVFVLQGVGARLALKKFLSDKKSDGS